MTTYAAALAEVVTLATIAARLTDAKTPEEALAYGVKAAKGAADRARTRTGEFRFETRSEDLERVGFIGAVAHEIEEGLFVSPRLGNVRALALKVLSLTSGDGRPVTEADVLGTVEFYDMAAVR